MLKLLAIVAALVPQTDSTYSGRLGQLDVAPPKIVDARIGIDGRLDEPAWGEAAVLSDFTQYDPVEDVAATERTEVRVFYADDAIYFGIRAWDSEPELILGRLGERDRVVQGDDWVKILLDTFGDERQAYSFYVNPLGLQSDGLWIEGRRGRAGGPSAVSIDFSPDFIWESDGRIDSEGWTAEVRIPYVSLRFREVPEQEWGLQVAREVKRRGFKQAWAPITKEITSTLAQNGRLVGLRDIHPERLIELNPVVTGIRVGAEDDGVFQKSDPEGDFGLNARLGVTQNVVLDATYNPDFSQVEADVNRLTINERFALFFPEKRSFFLEGAEIFSTPQRLVYTRRIVDPIAGLRLAGKVGSFNMGLISALDESPSSILGGAGNAAFNLFRVRRDMGAASTVGLLYTDRAMTNGTSAYNRVFAGDARLVFGGRYSFTTQVGGSLERDVDDDAHSGVKPIISASIARTGRSFAWNVDMTDVHPDFRTRSGFITRGGDAVVNGRATLTTYGKPGATLERASFAVSTENFFEHASFWRGGSPFEHEVQLIPTLSFRGGRSVMIILRQGYFRFAPESYSAYSVVEPDGSQSAFQAPAALGQLRAVGIIPRLRLTNKLNLNGRVYFREIPIFLEAARGYELQVGSDLQWKPTSEVQLSLNHTYSDISRRTTSDPYSEVNVSSLRAQYQFSRALFTRIQVQYELSQRAPLVDPTTGYPIALYGNPVGERSTGEFQGQFLVQYEPSPGTIFYIGYSRLMEGDRTYQLSTLNPVEEGVFVKLSYLFRM